MFIYTSILLRSLPAFMAIYFSAQKHFISASCLLIFSVVLDFLISLIKKKSQNQNKEFQLHLEGLVDFLAFGVSPGLFVFFLEPKVWIFIIVFIFCTGGMFRIARFNCEGLINGYYRGLPITYNGYIIPAVYFLIRYTGLFRYQGIIFSSVLLFVTFLMVSSKIRVKEIG